MNVNGENINLLPLPGIEPRLLGRATRSIVTIPTEPSWLLNYSFLIHRMKLEFK
jgi:hypothetical protein